MVETRQSPEPPPTEVRFSPRPPNQLIPVEIVDRQELLTRMKGRMLRKRERADFHILVICRSGTGTHYVDYEPVPLSAGTLLRIHPGQVQSYIVDSDLEASMVVWPRDSHHADPDGEQWFPGSSEPTSWHLDHEDFGRVLSWVEELRHEQETFDGSKRAIELTKALLCVFLLRLADVLPESPRRVTQLPTAYVDFRGLIELRLFERPSISELAHDLGYSSRTLDRACQQVTGQTAKQVLDERIALEIHRLLTHSSRPIARIAVDFGFTDPSNFSKFVKRHLGELPRAVRSA